MKQTDFEKYSTQRIAAMLMSAGVSPKYRAFAYLLYIMREFNGEEILMMDNKEVIDLISKRFCVRRDKIASNFRCLIEGCAYSGKEKSILFTLVPRLEKDEFPSVSEFVTAAICYQWFIEGKMKNEFEDDSGANTCTVDNSSVDDGVNQIRH